MLLQTAKLGIGLADQRPAPCVQIIFDEIGSGLGLVISGQVNRLTGKMHLTACSGKNILYWLMKNP